MRRATSGLALALLTGCPTDDAPVTADTDPTAQASGPTVVLARSLRFAREVDGISDGFDLDATDDDVCGVDDFTAPDGRTGIDNAFAGLLPVIELTGGQALESLVQATVDSGELLVMIRVEGLDGAAPGDCLPLEILRASGVPAIGGDGLVLPGQTFARNPSFEPTVVDCATLQEDGSVWADGFDFRLPIVVFDESIDLTLLDGQIRLTPTPTGWTAVLSGGVMVDEIAENVRSFDGVQDSLVQAILGALDLVADLPYDDEDCGRMSVALTMDGVSAWLYADDDASQ